MSWFRVVPDKSGAVTIGRYKEKLVREVAFPLPPLGEGGRYQANFQRPHAEAPYPLASRVEGQTLIWLVSLADTSDPGEGLVEIRWDGPNGETWKSPQYAVRIAKGLADPKEAPEAWAGFLQQVNRDAGRAESAADNAAKTLKKLEDGIASGDFRGEKGEKGEKGDPGPQGPKGEAGPAGDTTAADAAAEAAKQAAQEAQKAAEASAGSAAQAAESVGGLADDLEAAQKDIAKMKRAIKFQSELNKGQTWDFEVDTQEAYQRIVPSGAKAGAVMAVGGKTVAWNQLLSKFPAPGTYEGLTVEVSGANVSVSGTAIADVIIPVDYVDGATVIGHKYFATAFYGQSLNGCYIQGKDELDSSYYFVTNKNIFTAVGKKYRYNIRAKNGNVVAVNAQLMLIDLTLLYGPGNEPTDTTDPRIAQIEAYAAAHPEYNTGELVSAEVDEVDVMGANILRPSGTFPYSSGGITAIRNQDSTITINGKASGYPFFEVGRLQLQKGKTYFIPSATRIMLLKDGVRIIVHDSTEGFTSDKDYPDVLLEYAISPNQTFSNTVVALIVSVGSRRDYSPYSLTTYPIPSAVQALPGYGWSAGSVGNTVERTENGWQYVQRVGSVDLGTLDYTKEKNTFRAKLQGMQIVSTDVAFNGRCKSFISIRYRDSWTVDGTMSQDSAKRLVLIHSGYSDIASFLSYVRGTLLYYELTTPITTDITDLMGDSLAPFSVEAGGSITMHHPKADEGFAIDVPAKIQYITKLSEVSANG